MPVYSEHAIAAYFAYFKLDRSAYFGKNLRYKLACLASCNSLLSTGKGDISSLRTGNALFYNLKQSKKIVAADPNHHQIPSAA